MILHSCLLFCGQFAVQRHYVSHLERAFVSPSAAIFFGWYPFEGDGSGFHLIPYEMPLDIDVLGTGMESRVLCI